MSPLRTRMIGDMALASLKEGSRKHPTKFLRQLRTRKIANSFQKSVSPTFAKGPEFVFHKSENVLRSTRVTRGRC